MKLLITALLLFSTPFVFAGPASPPTQIFDSSTPNRTYVNFPHTDLLDPNLLSFSSNPDECRRKCDSTSGCAGYVIKNRILDNYQCYLKASANEIYRNRKFKIPYDSYLPVQEARKYNAFPVANYIGHDILYYEGSFQQCAVACDAFSGCVGYVLDRKKGKNCSLKSRMADPYFSVNMGKETFLIEDIAVRTREFIKFESTHFSKNVINHFTGSIDLCPYECLNTPNCVAYTIEKNKNTGCWLKSSTASAMINPEQDTFAIKSTAVKVFKELKEVDYSGDNLTYFVGEFSECAVACSSLEGCVGFSQDLRVGKNCMLKSELKSIVVDKERNFFILEN